jgi:hypothetical protein
MEFIWISELSSQLHVTAQRGFLASALPYVVLARFSRCVFKSHNVNHSALLSPVFILPTMPLPMNSAPYGVALYHDVGHGLRRAESQKSRNFRMPVVYSNPLADLCVNYSSQIILT